MQTSIVHSFIGISGVEDGKVTPSSPSTGDRFGKLFSHLILDESVAESDPDSDETVPSDTENPDDLPMGPEQKIQQPQPPKNAAPSEQETPAVTQNPGVAELNPNQVKNTGIAAPAQQIILPESSNLAALNLQVFQEHLTIIEQKSTHQLPVKQALNISANSGFQITPVREQNMLVSNGHAQDLQQISVNQPTENSNRVSIPVKPQILTERKPTPRSATDSELVKKSGLKMALGDKPQHSTVGVLKALPNMPPIVTAPKNYTLPTASATLPETHFSAEATEMIFASGEVIDNFSLAAEIAEAEYGRNSISLMLNQPAATMSETSRAGTVRFAGTQMVDALIRQPSHPVEIALNPEELGRVRIALSHLDSGLTVVITAERPETLDLMRRHIDQLEAEFRQLGYENIGFEFSGGDADSSDQSETEKQPSSDQMTDSPETTTLTPMSTQTTGVDIRL
ncbi:MAG: flagellar hook-length control protein FliK [Paracoccaceae bacterium]